MVYVCYHLYIGFMCILLVWCVTAARLLHLFTQHLPSMIINKYDDVARKREGEESEGKIKTPFTCIVSSPRVCDIFRRYRRSNGRKTLA